ncbi:hypothetical protein SK128_018296 [Halocaridina rubra]|uniref:Uncharacterized protein n=1 Tax=Halocaridina rubra TaxID=373956 RepID=A0AAN8WTB4_HALRR
MTGERSIVDVVGSGRFDLDCNGDKLNYCLEARCLLQEAMNLEKILREMQRKLCILRLDTAMMITEFATLNDPLMRHSLALALQSEIRAASVIQNIAFPNLSRICPRPSPSIAVNNQIMLTGTFSEDNSEELCDIDSAETNPAQNGGKNLSDISGNSRRIGHLPSDEEKQNNIGDQNSPNLRGLDNFQKSECEKQTPLH